MTRSKLFTTLALTATMAATAIVPTVASANLQSNKNNMRNLAIAGAVVAGYGLLNHNTAATLIGGVGAAIAGSQYEKDRHEQSQWNNRWYGDHRDWGNGYQDRDYHRDNHNYNRDHQDRR